MLPLLCLFVVASCRPTNAESTDPDETIEEGMIGGGGASGTATEAQRLDQLYGARSALPARPPPEEKCEGDGAEKSCAMVDPDPELAAAHAARDFMTQFRWGMNPKAVLEQLGKEVKDASSKNASTDPMKQDARRRELEADLEELKSHHVVFSSRDSEKWRATLVKKLVTPEEEMVWYGTSELRRYFFFSGGKLWHIGAAYSKRMWPKKTYAQVIESDLKPLFGYSASEQEVRDERSREVLVRYHEWKSQDGDLIRAFDLIEGHGVILVSVLKADVEANIGRRIPENKIDRAIKGGEDLQEVMKEEGICYDENGDMIHDPVRCKELKEKESE